MNVPITTDEIEKFVAAWYALLDFHAAADDCCKMLADRGLKMHFSETEIHSLDAFRKWYEKVINKFFDEQHTVHSVKVKLIEKHAEIDVIVGWQSSWWEPRAP